MIRHNKPSHAIAALALLSSLNATAAETGWYVGASGGRAESDVDAEDFKAELEAAGATGVVASFDNTDTGWKLYGGYKFDRNLAFEVGYVNLGEQKGRATYVTPAGSPVNLTVELDAIEIALVGSLPLSESLALFAKLGGYAWNADTTVSSTFGGINDDDDGFDALYGLGASLGLGQNWSVRAEWERFVSGDSSDGDIDFFSAGAVYRF